MFTAVTLRDGRTLEYVDLGDPEGAAVLFCPGTPSTAGQASIIADAARSIGIRLVGISRPGYGASTPTPPSLAWAAGDAVELADQLELDRFTTMGLSGGGPFALAVAAVAPERVTTVVVHAGTATYFDVMPPSDADAAERRAVAMFAAGDRDGAVAEMTRSADADFGALRELSEADFDVAMLATTPPAETWLERHPDARKIFLADFRRAITGSAGYVRDNLSWGGEWDVDLAAVTAPVRMVYGDADAMVPMSHAEWLRDRLPTADLHVVPGGHGDATFGAAGESFRVVAASAARRS